MEKWGTTRSLIVTSHIPLCVVTLSPTLRLENACFSNKGGVLFVSKNHTSHEIAKTQRDVSNVKGKIITQAFANKIPLCREIPAATQGHENTVLFIDTKTSVSLQTTKMFRFACTRDTFRYNHLLFGTGPFWKYSRSLSKELDLLLILNKVRNLTSHGRSNIQELLMLRCLLFPLTLFADQIESVQ